MANTFKLNNKTFDLDNKDDIKEALKALHENKDEYKTGFAFIDIFVHEACEKLIKSLEGRLQELEEQEEEDLPDWKELGVDWQNKYHCLADEYLTQTYGDDYDSLEAEKQAKAIKSLAEFAEWVDKQ